MVSSVNTVFFFKKMGKVHLFARVNTIFLYTCAIILDPDLDPNCLTLK